MLIITRHMVHFHDKQSVLVKNGKNVLLLSGTKLLFLQRQTKCELNKESGVLN